MDPADILQDIALIEDDLRAGHTFGAKTVGMLCQLLRTALADTRRVDWQPIGTAPKQIPVLVYVPFSWIAFVAWYDSDAQIWKILGGNDFNEKMVPTHWMRIPDLPTPNATMAATPEGSNG
jgi:hypothetical protein